MTAGASEREYARRRDRLAAILARIGDLRTEERELGDGRILLLVTEAPGHDSPGQAVFEYREVYSLERQALALTDYTYEYREIPPPGRRAYHWHDREYHMHCVDGRHPSRDHHFRAYAVNPFEAHEEFYRIYASRQPVSCTGLRPSRAL